MTNALVVRFRADTAAAETGVSNLAKVIGASMAASSTAMVAASRNGETSFGSLARSAGSFVTGSIVQFALLRAAVLTTSAVISYALVQAAADMEEMTALVKKASSANVGAGYFQAFTAGAKDLRLEVGTLESALNSAFQATKEKTGESNAIQQKLAEYARNVFSANAPSQGYELFANAKTQEEKIRAVLVQMVELKARGEDLKSLDLAEAMFGAKFADEIRRGKIDVDQFLTDIDRRKQGLSNDRMFSQEEIKTLDDLNERLGKAGREIAQGLNPLIADMRTLLIWSYEGAVKFSEALAIAARNAGSLYAALKDVRLPDLSNEGTLEKRLTGLKELVESDGFKGFSEGRRKGLQDQLQRAEAALRDERIKNGKSGVDLSGMGNDAAIVPNLGPVAAPLGTITAPVPGSRSANAYQEPKAGKAESDTRLNEIERYVEGLERSGRLLQAEISTLGMSNAERERANAIAKIGLTDEELKSSKYKDQYDEIIRIADANAVLKTRVEELKQAQKDYADAVRFGGNMLLDYLDKGEISIKSLQRSLLQFALMGDGPLAPLMRIFGVGGAVSPMGGGNQVGGLLGGLFGLGGAATAGVATVGASAPLNLLPFGFANGGIMTEKGPLPLRRYAGGGIARTPQLAMYAEAGMAEAYVPLPDGRSIPVTLSVPEMPRGGAGGGQTFVSAPQIVIDIDARGSDEGSVQRLRDMVPMIIAEAERKIVPAVAVRHRSDPSYLGG